MLQAYIKLVLLNAPDGHLIQLYIFSDSSIQIM